MTPIYRSRQQFVEELLSIYGLNLECSFNPFACAPDVNILIIKVANLTRVKRFATLRFSRYDTILIFP